MALKLITAPAVEPLTLAEAKLHLRVTGSDEDALITSLIVAARRMAEQRSGRALCDQTWELALDAFPAGAIELPRPPVSSIVSIKYLDAAGADQTLAADQYALDNYGGQHWALPAQDVAWPGTLAAANAVKVRFVAGYGAAAAVPADIKAWLLLAIGTLYAQRETVVADQAVELPGGFWQSLLDPYRVIGF
jgi:uncharacterized phiE125 gp8 family phage protein